MKLEKAWMTFGIVTFLCQIASLMLDASGVISVLVLGLFIVGCGLCFASLFKIVHHYTTSAHMRIENHVTTKQEPETKLKPQNLEPTAGNQELKVTDESEEVAYRRKLECALRIEGGE